MYRGPFHPSQDWPQFPVYLLYTPDEVDSSHHCSPHPPFQLLYPYPFPPLYCLPSPGTYLLGLDHRGQKCPQPQMRWGPENQERAGAVTEVGRGRSRGRGAQREVHEAEWPALLAGGGGPGTLTSWLTPRSLLLRPGSWSCSLGHPTYNKAARNVFYCYNDNYVEPGWYLPLKNPKLPNFWSYWVASPSLVSCTAGSWCHRKAAVSSPVLKFSCLVWELAPGRLQLQLVKFLFLLCLYSCISLGPRGTGLGLPAPLTLVRACCSAPQGFTMS